VSVIEFVAGAICGLVVMLFLLVLLSFVFGL
jgi:hypothetical protein